MELYDLEKLNISFNYLMQAVLKVLRNNLSQVGILNNYYDPGKVEYLTIQENCPSIFAKDCRLSLNKAFIYGTRRRPQ